ncbi:MAG: ion channel [Cytophagales bacterium]
MAKNQTNNFKTDNDTGFASLPNSQGDTLFGKDGSVNVLRKGLSFSERFNVFHTLLSMSWSQFGWAVVLFYVLINIFFALIYYFIGVEHLNGTITDTEVDKLLESFFFSTQTFATVGYGRINPTGILTNIVASLEALLGVLSLALVTSLLYSRFSRPKINLVYSKNLLVAPFLDKTALMFRLANAQNELLIECEIQIIVRLKVTNDGITNTTFINLPLERSKVATLALNWTIVHALDDESPIKNYSAEDLANAEAEFLISLKLFDNTYSQIIHTRSSYKFDEMIWGAKFKPMFHRSEGGNSTVLELDKISAYELVDLKIMEKN